jgi:hypothetical protein
MMSSTPFRGRPVDGDGDYYLLVFNQTHQVASVNSSPLTHTPDNKQISIEMSSLAAVRTGNPFGLPGSCSQLGMTSLHQLHRGKPFGNITPPAHHHPAELPARAHGELPGTCGYAAETGAVLSLQPELPVLLVPGMPDIQPGSCRLYKASKWDPCDWQSWFLNVQVGKQIHGLQVSTDACQ